MELAQAFLPMPFQVVIQAPREIAIQLRVSVSARQPFRREQQPLFLQVLALQAQLLLRERVQVLSLERPSIRQEQRPLFLLVPAQLQPLPAAALFRIVVPEEVLPVEEPPILLEQVLPRVPAHESLPVAQVPLPVQVLESELVLRRFREQPPWLQAQQSFLVWGSFRPAFVRTS